MSYTVSYTKQFKKSVEKCRKRGYDMSALRTALEILIDTGTLPQNYHPHKLSGDKDGQWECHIKSDWLMTWEQNGEELTLLMLDTGTHSDLFGKKRK